MDARLEEYQHPDGLILCLAIWILRTLHLEETKPYMRTSKVSISPFEPSDFGAVLALLQAELYTDKISQADFCQKVLSDPNFRAESALTAKLGSQIIGFMLGLTRKHPLENTPPDLDRSWITLMAVHRDYQRTGIGTRLLEAVRSRLKSLGAQSIWVSPYVPNYFWPGVDEAAYSGAKEFLTKHGFVVASRPLSMEAPLEQFGIPDWVYEKEWSLQAEGISFRVFEARYAIALEEHVRHEFPGDWQRCVREAMTRIINGATTANHIWIAILGSKCVGFCVHDSERFGPFGVAASHRGCGVGTVLLFHCLESMKTQGLRRAWLMWTEDLAARLYSRAGFRETQRFAIMRRQL